MASTSWAGIETPENPDDPNLPFDLKKMADKIDLAFSRVVGGSTMPPSALGPYQVVQMGDLINTLTINYNKINTDVLVLKPKVSALESQIGSLQLQADQSELDINVLEPKVSTLQTNFTNLSGQVGSMQLTVDGLELRPYKPTVVVNQRTTAFTLVGTQTADQTVISQSIPAVTWPRLVIANYHSVWGWNTGGIDNSVQTKLRIGVNDTARSTQRGNVQTHAGWGITHLDAGGTSTVSLFVRVYNPPAAGPNFISQDLHPRVSVMTIPWFGAAPNIPLPSP